MSKKELRKEQQHKTLKKRQVSIVSLSHESQRWQINSDPGLSVRLYFGAAHDSVALYRNGIFTGSFLSENDMIISTRLVLSDPKGKVLSIDSFRMIEGSNYWDIYFENFHASLVVRKEYYPSGIASKAVYRSTYGTDLASYEWSTEGILLHKKINGAEYAYSSEGILNSKHTEKSHIEYSNGVIASIASDTLILDQLVKHTRKYHPNGVLQQESWLLGDKPVSTWREYNAQGVLVKTTRHPAIQKAVLSFGVMELPAEKVFVFVKQDASFPGGTTSLYQYLNTELKQAFSNSRHALSGRYQIRFEVMEDGSVRYISAHGMYVADIEDSLKYVIEKMPAWYASKRSGKPVSETMLLQIDVSDL